jgi:glycosyltransferase involved in cell wall biosynthesis/GT2 family glycosyltransferase
MAVKENFLRPLLDGFTSPDVFSVSAQIFFWDPSRRREETGKTRTVWHRGLVDYAHEAVPETSSGAYTPVFWLGGGSAAVDRRKFLSLGGFHALFSPFYMEDVDLSYRAWKRGWVVLFTSESEVLHKHRSSTGKLDRTYVEQVIYRNRLLFIWANITDLRMFAEHLAALPFAFLRKSWDLNERQTLAVFMMALRRLPQAMIQRNRNRIREKVSDREVFMLANSPFWFKEKRFAPPTVDPERLKILMVCPYFPALRSGGGVRMNQMIRALAKKHEVSVLSFWDEEPDLKYLPELERICKRVKIVRRYPVQPRSRVHVLPPAIEIEFGDPGFHQALLEMLSEEDFNIIQAEFLQIAPQIPDSRRLVRVITHHEVQNAAVQTRLAVERSRFQRAILKLQWMRWLNADINLCRPFDRVVALTPEDAWELARYAPDLPVEVILTGIDLEYFAPQPEEETPNSIIFVGNFRHTPNIESVQFLARDVMPLIWQSIPDARLYLVGANPPQPVLDLAMADRILVTGWVEDMRPYVARANVYAFPIRTGVGLRNKILEAWAMAKPTVTSRLGSAGLNGVHGENIWFAESAEEFAEGICTLLQDAPLRQRIGRNARQYVEERHTWQNLADRYEEVYREALHDRGFC